MIVKVLIILLFSKEFFVVIPTEVEESLRFSYAEPHGFSTPFHFVRNDNVKSLIDYSIMVLHDGFILYLIAPALD